MIRLFGFRFVYRGVNIGNIANIYRETSTKRKFMFYGIQVGWVMFGFTIARKAKAGNEPR
jgi:hypothetical protein